MPNYTQGYERRTQPLGQDTYNPVITEYYGSDDAVVRIEKTFRGRMYAQTISGSSYAEQWPDYSYSVTYGLWEETTVS